MSIVKEFAEGETKLVEKVVEKASRTKKLEGETADLRKDLEGLTTFVYRRLQTSNFMTPETTYDSQVYQLFTARIESFEDLHFCVEPDVGLGFAQIFLHSDDSENFDYTREENIILYSVNGTVVYKQPIGFAMDVIAKAKMEKKENKAVIFGLLDTWFDESEEEDENEEKEEEKEKEAAEKEAAEEEKKEENLKDKDLQTTDTSGDEAVDFCICLIFTFIMFAFMAAMAYAFAYFSRK